MRADVHLGAAMSKVQYEFLVAQRGGIFQLGRRTPFDSLPRALLDHAVEPRFEESLGLLEIATGVEHIVRLLRIDLASSHCVGRSEGLAESKLVEQEWEGRNARDWPRAQYRDRLPRKWRHILVQGKEEVFGLFWLLDGAVGDLEVLEERFDIEAELNVSRADVGSLTWSMSSSARATGTP